MMMTVKASEIQVGDVIRFCARVESVKINKRVSVRMDGYRGPVTYALDANVQVERS